MGIAKEENTPKSTCQ